MGNFTYTVFFVSVRGGVYPSNESDRKEDGSPMEEPYKEMYIHLYKNVKVLEDVLQTLSAKMGHTLNECMELYLVHFENQMQDKDDIQKQFENLLNTP